MRADRPASLEALRRDRMHQLAGRAPDRAKAARATLGQAHDFRRAAIGNLAEALVLPAISALHESARLAVTALAALALPERDLALAVQLQASLASTNHTA